MIEREAGASAAQENSTGRSFDAFFADEYRRLFQTLVLVCGEPGEAEDVAQETFVRIYEHWDRIAAMEAPVAYLYRSALNEHRSRLRSRLRWVKRSLLVRQMDDEVSAAAIARADIARGLKMLSPEQREAVALVEWAGLSAAEAGLALEIDADAVRSRIHRARVILREVWVENE